MLRDVIELNLTGNVLEVLPEEFGKLNFLELLDLSGNQLKQLPKEFPGCIRYTFSRHVFSFLYICEYNFQYPFRS